MRLGDSGTNGGDRPESVIPQRGSKTRLKVPPQKYEFDNAASFL